MRAGNSNEHKSKIPQQRFGNKEIGGGMADGIGKVEIF
jgi:hypothetical protein